MHHGLNNTGVGETAGDSRFDFYWYVKNMIIPPGTHKPVKPDVGQWPPERNCVGRVAA